MEIFKDSIEFYKEIRKIFVEYINKQKIMLSIFNVEICEEINDILDIENYFIDPLDAIKLILNNDHYIKKYIKHVKIHHIINNNEGFAIDFDKKNNNNVIIDNDDNNKQEYLKNLNYIINKNLGKTYNGMQNFINKYNIKYQDKN